MSFDAKNYSDYEFFTISQIEPGFVHVQYTNPKTLNAFTEKNWRNYGEIFKRLDQESDVQLILVSSGVPRSFSSGLNLKAAMELFGSDEPRDQAIKHLHEHIVDFQELLVSPQELVHQLLGF